MTYNAKRIKLSKEMLLKSQVLIRLLQVMIGDAMPDMISECAFLNKSAHVTSLRDANFSLHYNMSLFQICFKNTNKKLLLNH